MSFALSENGTDDTIDIRDVIERFEELETELRDAWEEKQENHNLTFEEYLQAIKKDQSAAHAHELLDECKEYLELEYFLESAKGYGGDEQWKGDWYPVTFINESYFEDYAQELATDCDMIKRDARWPNNHIDWTAAAKELKQDYSEYELDGVTYLAR